MSLRGTKTHKVIARSSKCLRHSSVVSKCLSVRSVYAQALSFGEMVDEKESARPHDEEVQDLRDADTEYRANIMQYPVALICE